MLILTVVSHCDGQAGKGYGYLYRSAVHVCDKQGGGPRGGPNPEICRGWEAAYSIRTSILHRFFKHLG